MSRDVNVEWYVSLDDVIRHPSYGNGGDLKNILYDFGMDVSKGYIDDKRWTEKCEFKEDVDEYDYTHRSLSGNVVKCARFVGIARSDGKWRRFVSHFLNLPAEFSGQNL